MQYHPCVPEAKSRYRVIETVTLGHSSKTSDFCRFDSTKGFYSNIYQHGKSGLSCRKIRLMLTRERTLFEEELDINDEAGSPSFPSWGCYHGNHLGGLTLFEILMIVLTLYVMVFVWIKPGTSQSDI